jgi:hypothetical protein
VTVIPDVNKTVVFRSGIIIGLNGMIPSGGHLDPISGVGDRLE